MGEVGHIYIGGCKLTFFFPFCFLLFIVSMAHVQLGSLRLNKQPDVTRYEARLSHLAPWMLLILGAAINKYVNEVW